MSSSIFNFDDLGRAFKLRLKDKVAVAFLIATAAVSVPLCASFLYHLIDGRNANLKSLQGLEAAQVLVLGNSELLVVRETSEPIAVKNLAIGGAGHSVNAALLRHYVPRMPNLQLVVLGFDNISFRVSDCSQMGGDYREFVDGGLPWYAIPDIGFLRRVKFLACYNPLAKPLFVGPKLYDIDASGLSALPGRLCEILWNRDFLRPRNCVTFRNRAIPRRAVTEKQAVDKIRMYVERFKRQTGFNSHTRSFFNMLEYCGQQDLQVLLVQAPTVSSFRENMPAQWIQDLQSIRRHALQVYPEVGLPLWDPAANQDFPLSLFWDPNHLNPEGAELFNRLFMEELRGRIFGPGGVAKR